MKILSELVCKQFIQLIEEFPAELEEITQTLKHIVRGEKVDVVYYVESHYHDINPRRNHVPSTEVDKGNIDHRRDEVAEPAPIKAVGKAEALEKKPSYEGTQELPDLDDDQVEQEKLLEVEKRDMEIARKMQREWDQEQGFKPKQED